MSLFYNRLINELNLLPTSFEHKIIKHRNILVIPSNARIKLSKKEMNFIYNNIIICSGAKLTTKKKNGILKLQSKNIIKLCNGSIIEVNGKGFKGGKQSDPYDKI